MLAEPDAPSSAAGIGQAAPDGRSLDAVRALIRDGRPYDALQVLTAYLEEMPGDADGLFLLSDLYQMTGEVDAALDPLLEILRFPPTPEVARRARTRLNLLINAREQQLANVGDLTSLVAFFEHLVLAEPGWDGHRLKLAGWLLRSGRTEEAARLIREVGLEGVSQEQIDALAGEIELARSSLPVERHGGAMYTTVTVAGAKRRDRFRFLIDTGATMTGLGEAHLRRLGARRVAEGIRVRTANGTVLLPVYRIVELRLGGLVLGNLMVLGFSDLPENADGLLGMDVLSRLSGSLPGAVGRPVNPG